MMKKTLLTAIGCLSLYPLFSQNHVEALRYSGTRFGSTARNLSMGGAFGAIGADASVLSVNPAGLAQYRASELSFGLSSYSTRYQTNYAGVSTNSSVFNLAVPNFAYVGTRILNTDNPDKKWQSYSIGFGLNRLNNYWREMNYQGNNRQSSITHHFAQRANGIPEADLTTNTIEGLAYNTYLINPTGSGNTYRSAITDSSINVQQRGRFRTEGNMNEYNLAFGANYNNRLYLGVGIMVGTVRFSSVESFKESDAGMMSNFRTLEYTSRVNTNATGIGARLGMIFRVSDMLRFGASVQTPVEFNMIDEFDYSMSSTFDTGSSYYYETEPLTFDYKVSTPFRATLSGAVLFQKKGIVSADVEFIDYSRASLSSLDYDYNQENRDIGSFYKQAVNVRLGAEYVYDVFRFRGGFAWYGSPFSNEFDVHGLAGEKTYTAGLGIRGATYFVDLGYRYAVQDDYYIPYTVVGRESFGVLNKIKVSNVVLTAGFRFE